MPSKGSVPRACERCGAAFTAFPSQIASGRGRFCSKRCANHEPRPRARHQVTLFCPVCGVAFAVYPNQVRRGRVYCDRICAAKGMPHGSPLFDPAASPCAGVSAPDLPGEHWRPVVGYEGLYEVSDQGRVRNIARGHRRTPGRLKAATAPRRGDLYPKVALNAHGRTTYRHLHRIVGDAFLGLLPEGFHTDHINGVKTDNRLANLEYVPLRENLRRARALGLQRWLRGEDKPDAKLTSEDVRAIRCLHVEGFSLEYIGALFFVNSKHIWRIAKRETWAHVP